jgi:pilus assembly protein Flp/PilA
LSTGADVNRIFRRFGRDERAATAFEYCLIAGIVSVAVIVGATVIGTSLNRNYSDISTGVNGP